VSDAQKPVGAIFDAAIELPPDGRAAYLQEACGDDDALRKRVEALLRAHESAEKFMDMPAVVVTGEAVANKAAEQIGERIGRYKLLQRIGEGGCGVVYLAEQEEPVHRRVALKVIKLGMDTKSVIARFEAERQALALMDHPNIAKVLDAGATDTGRPFFVMELVKAVPITRYCDENNLSTVARLGLFVQVCQAIQHAHQKGIIHRDIKPSNILVADHDGVPVPKIIDFGIAKATNDQRLTDRTVFTALEQFIGTPAYMSPEQAKLSGLDIDTRTDIYSLGVLLYELLTGKTPFEAKRLLEAGLDEVRRIIREEEPVTPSTRLHTLDAAEQTTVARLRQSDPPKLLHLIRGDLDWIVMKCLEKDRARRYETANGLAMDIQRHLGNEPILARSPSAAYRLQKAWRRHKTAFVAGALMTAVLVAATGVSTWQAILAKQRLVESKANETLAKERLAESEAITKFMSEVFQSPGRERNGRTITVAETLGSAAKKLETELTNQPALRATLEATLGRTYFSLGLDREAIPLQESSFNYRRTVLGPENPETLQVMNDLATSYSGVMGYQSKAVALSEQLLTLHTKISGSAARETIAAKRILAIHYFEIGRRNEAIQMMEEGLALSRKVYGPEDELSLVAMSVLGYFYKAGGHPAEAVKMGEETLGLLRKVKGPEDRFTIDEMRLLADSYQEAGRRDEALNLREQTVPLCRKVLGPEHATTLRAINDLAGSYEEAGHRAEALNLRENALPLVRKANAPEGLYTLEAITDLAGSYQEAGRREEAIKLWQEALPLSCKTQGFTCPMSIAIMDNLACCLVGLGRVAEAIALQAQYCERNPGDTSESLTLAAWQAWFGKEVDYEATRQRLVQRALGTNDAGTAERAAKAACLRPSTNAVLLANVLTLAQRAADLGKSDSSLPWYQLELGLAEYRNGQFAAAEEPLTIAEQTVGDDKKEITATARLFHAMSLFRQNRTEEARTLFGQAQAQMSPYPKDESQPLVNDDLAEHDTLILWLAYKETRELIGDPSTPVAEPSARK
jgi:serine/threonine protein kinase/tetratricopeptide (TPR) repeat protein